MKNLVKELVKHVRQEIGAQCSDVRTPNGTILVRSPGEVMNIHIRENYPQGRITLAVRLSAEYVVHINE